MENKIRKMRADKKEQIKWKKNRNVWKGSYTVEAAVILPLTALILAAIIFAAFYVHDRSTMQGMACEIAAAGSNCITEAQRGKRTAALRSEVKSQRFLGSKGVSANVASGKTEVSAALEGAYQMPGMVMRFFSNGVLEVRGSWKMKNVEPAKTIWQIRGAAAILGGER